jgi:hypothetical protein
MPDLTPEQEKALIEAVTEDWRFWVDAWDRGLNDQERKWATVGFLAGVRWAQKEKR